MTLSNPEAKRFLGGFAAARVAAGMRLGIGSGTTVAAFIDALAERNREFGLNVTCVAASMESERHAKDMGLKVEPLERVPELDLAVDGADAVNFDRVLIKGAGGAVVRERLVMASARESLILVDAAKPAGPFRNVIVPIVVVPYGWRHVRDRVRQQGVRVDLRKHGSQPVTTDEGLQLLDAHFAELKEPKAMHASLKAIEGVVDTGIFAEYEPDVWISDGVAVWPLNAPEGAS